MSDRVRHEKTPEYRLIDGCELKMTIRDDYLARVISAMQGNGLIRRIGPDKGGHWEVVFAAISFFYDLMFSCKTDNNDEADDRLCCVA